MAPIRLQGMNYAYDSGAPVLCRIFKQGVKGSTKYGWRQQPGRLRRHLPLLRVG